VLAVDDDEDTREFVRLALGQFGAHVRTVGTAREALAFAAAEPPDVVVSDIGMPEIDELQLLSHLREQAAPPGFRTIALTAYASVEDARRIRASGYELHLRKPIEPVRLALAVARLCAAPRVAGS
jgi:CheY-like chemotaxis protein